MEAVAPIVVSTVASGSITGIIGGIIVIILMMVPLIMKFWNSSKEASTQISLYTQLSEQVRLQSEEIKQQRLEIERVVMSRSDLLEKLNELKGKVHHLESVESNNEKLRETIEVLKDRLDEKDLIIRDRDNRIANLIREILTMKDRVHNLELRLKSDEMKFTADINEMKLTEDFYVELE